MSHGCTLLEERGAGRGPRGTLRTVRDDLIQTAVLGSRARVHRDRLDCGFHNFPSTLVLWKLSDTYLSVLKPARTPNSLQLQADGTRSEYLQQLQIWYTGSARTGATALLPVSPHPTCVSTPVS